MKAVFDASQTAVLAIFNQALPKQPRYLAQIGCQDGQLLKQYHRLICQHSQRGAVLGQWPLTLVAIVDDEPMVAAITETLQGLPHQIVLSKDAGLAEWAKSSESIFYLYHDAPKQTAEPTDWQTFFTHWGNWFTTHGCLVLAQHQAVNAEQFLLRAANAGLFARTQPIRFPQNQPICQFSLSHFDRRDYLICHARLSDLDVLVQLEQDCWLPALQTSEATLAERLARYPQGQFVLELNAQVVGVIYSQRIIDRQQLLTVSADTAENLHQADAPVVHLIAVNILPDMQHRALGDQLLEFMLQRCSLMDGVESVTAVTRCKEYQAESGVAMANYIRLRNAQGRLLDPVLRFHELHGADIESVVLAYRPLDLANKGNGVLVHYAIHQRRRDELQAETSEPNSHTFGDQHIKTFVGEAIRRCLGDKSAAFAADRALMAMGLDSADLLQLGEQLGSYFQIKLEPSFFFHYGTAGKIAANLSQRLTVRPELAEEAKPIAFTPHAQASVKAVQTAADDIAIIGISGYFPMANNLAEFWENLIAGKNCISEVPPERWDWRSVNPDLALGGKTTSNPWGGFIDGIAEFDAEFFNIPPRDVQAMDPQLRQMIRHIWLALEEAGINPEVFAQTPTGVFIAAAPNEYRQLLATADQRPEDGTTLFSSSVANRISQLFDFQGPSECYEAACASSLLAIHKAVVSLQQQECQQAVVAAVNLLISPIRHQAAEALGYLSPDGQARSFQADANGFVRAEGVGAIILKSLALALADGDNIHAVIKGSAVAHGGKGVSLIAPNPLGMKTAIIKAYRNAGINPNSVSYIEAHGVASPLSDAQEINALKAAYRELAVDEVNNGVAHPLYISTVKPCIGHTELASGMAALFKVILAMRHRTIAGLLRFSKLHEQICLDDSPLQIATQHHAWQALHDGNGKPLPRRASINGYGDAGVNAHLVLEEFTETRVFSKTEQGRYLIVLSAQTEMALATVVKQLGQFLQTEDGCLADLSYTLQVGRKPLAKRLALLVENRQQLLEALRDYPNISQIPVYRDTQANNQSLFSGKEEAVWLQEMMEAKDWQALAAYWVQGGQIPWAMLYQGQQIQRLSLPTYPFASTSYWLPERKPASPSAPVKSQDSPTGYTDLGTFLQQNIADILGVKSALPPQKSLYELGFTSLHALSLKAVLEQRYHITFPVSAIDVYCPLADVEALLNTWLADSASKATDDPLLPVLTLDPANRHQPFPLTDIQQAFLLGRQLGHAGTQVGCHIYLEMDFAGLDIYRLNQAWNRLLAHHDMLRAVFADGQQRVLEAVPYYPFKVLDLRRKTPPEQAEALMAVRGNMAHKVYSPEIWPLFEIRLSLSQAGGYRLHFSIDELIADASSVELLFQQWQQLYGQPDGDLPVLDLPFRDYVLAMHTFEASTRYRLAMQYWLDKLATLPAGPQLPMTGKEGSRRIRLARNLNPSQWQSLKARAALLKVSPTALLLAVFSLVLQNRSASPNFTLILTFFNRLPLHPQIGQVFAPFISTTLFAVDDPGECSFAEFIVRIQEALLTDLNHSSVSGIRVLRELKRGKGRADMALPVVFTSLLGKPSGRGPDSFLEQVSYSVTQTPQVLLDHQTYEQDGELRWSWDVAEAYFPTGSIDSLFADYQQLLSQLADSSGRWHEPLAEFVHPVLSDNALPFMNCPAEQRVFALTEQQQAYTFGKSVYGSGISSQFYSCFETEYLDVPRLQHAWQKLMNIHDMLVMVVHPDGTQTRLDDVPEYEIAVHDLRGTSPAEQEAAVQTLGKTMMARNCPLGAWPYFDLQVSRLDAGKSKLHVCIELLIADAPSVSLLLEQWFYYYQHPAEIPPSNTLRYADYLWAVQNCQQTTHHQQCSHYWEKKFADMPSGPVLPTTNQTIAQSTERLDGVLTHWQAIKTTASQLSVSPTMVLLAAYAQVLMAWSETPRFTIVIPIWQREALHPDINKVVGDFTVLSWVTVNNDKASFAEHVSAYQQTVKNDLAHRAVSGLKILRKLTMQRRERVLKFPVVFTDLEPPRGDETPQNFSLCQALSQTAAVDLDNLSSEINGQLLLHWDVAQGCYPDGMVQAMFAAYQGLLAYLAENPQAWQEIDFGFLIRPFTVSNL